MDWVIHDGLGYPWGSIDPRGFGWIWVKNKKNCGLVWGAGSEMKALYVLMDNGLNLGDIFREMTVWVRVWFSCNGVGWNWARNFAP